MLVLSRKVDEQIIIGDHIRVTVVSIRGNQVRLDFEAPPSVPIFRQELRQEHGHLQLPVHSTSELSQLDSHSAALLTAAGED